MWRRALACSAPVLRSSHPISGSLKALCRPSFANLPSTFLPIGHLLLRRPSGRCCGVATRSHDDNDMPVPSANYSNFATTAAELSGAPGVQGSGDKFVMVYTCSICETRSAKTISKHAYYKGVVLVRCPGCENLHLVADRLGWFEDNGIDVESILKQKGEKVRFATAEDVLELTENGILGP